jgi:hypothetical protein
MQGIGAIEDGFTFTEAEIQRASPRFWWGPRKRAAYDRVLERRGLSRTRDEAEDRDDDRSGSDADDHRRTGTAVAAGTIALSESLPEKRQENGGSSSGSWFDKGSDDGGGSSSDRGSGSSDSGGSDGGGGGGSGE